MKKRTVENVQTRQGFWQEALALHGSVTPQILPLVLSFGLLAGGICCLVWAIEKRFHLRLNLAITPYQLAGALLGLLLVFRINSGYDRWWEGRKLWGGIVNQSRNFAISSLSYGPENPAWRKEVIHWAAVFPHILRSSLRDENPSSEVVNLLGKEETDRIAASEHMPMFVILKLALLLREARSDGGMDGFAFLQVDRERALLIDHTGGCERILTTPLPRLYSIKIRRFIHLFLLTVPFALLHQLNGDFWVPLVTMLLAYALLSLDQMGVELENPFLTSRLSHLPLDDLGATIERNLLGLLKAQQAAAVS